MYDNLLLDPLGYIARGRIVAPRYTLSPLSAEERDEVEARRKETLELRAREEANRYDEDGDPAF